MTLLATSIEGCICVSLAIAVSSSCTRRVGRRWLTLEAEAEFALELDQSTDGSKRSGVLLAAECGQHPGMVAERRDRGSKASAERFTRCRPAEVVIAARPRGLDNEALVLADDRSPVPFAGPRRDRSSHAR